MADVVSTDDQATERPVSAFVHQITLRVPLKPTIHPEHQETDVLLHFGNGGAKITLRLFDRPGVHAGVWEQVGDNNKDECRDDDKVFELSAAIVTRYTTPVDISLGPGEVTFPYSVEMGRARIHGPPKLNVKHGFGSHPNGFRFEVKGVTLVTEEARGLSPLS